MYFQIRRLIIWPKSDDVSPKFQSIEFELGKVNVITGESRTGKSAIIPIIDYCLASSHNLIPIDKIRDYASWYAVEIVVAKNQHVLVARKAPPEGKNTSEESALEILDGEYVPTATPPARNKSADDIKGYFDNLFGLPYLEHQNIWQDKRLSFRDLMHFAFQSQDIVANQNVLFYKTHETQYREKLTNWFDFIIGAETQEMMDKRRQLDDSRREFRQIELALKVAVSTMEKRKGDLRGQLTLAKQLGVINDPNMAIPEEFDSLLILAKMVVDTSSTASVTKMTAEKVLAADQDIAKQRNRQIEVMNDVAKIQARLADLKSLRGGVDSFGNVLRKRKDRLEISKWLEMNTEGGGVCPICGGDAHPEASVEFKKICDALKRHEAAANVEPNPFAACDRVKSQQEELLKIRLQELQELEDYFTEIRRANEKAREYESHIEQVSQLLADLRATLKLAKDLDQSSGLKSRYAELKDLIAGLEIWFKAHNAEIRAKEILGKICGIAKQRLISLDCEEVYKSAPPGFNKRYLNLTVKGKDGQYHLLGEVGSASNWVAFHLAFMSALQEYFSAQDNSSPSYIPSFAIFDQPSQVYFPEMKASDDYTDVDVDAVRGMFKTLSDAVSASEGRWQAIVLEHAGSTMWAGLGNVVKAGEWRGGVKLIPTAWYE